jgi:EAL domain-containing protein (putative c-di-GMP-specific phosphodiesterase class I)
MSLQSSIDVVGAIDAEQFRLDWQAIVDPRTGRKIGLEALLRWHHPNYGVLLPARFLPAGDRGGVGLALTAHVFDLALGQQARWQRAGWDVPISVNVSPDVLVNDQTLEILKALLRRYGSPPDRLTVEVTERSCGVEVDALGRSLSTLSQLGIRTSLDDFGTGESSLSRLRMMHFDELKIDRSFVAHLDVVPTDRCIVKFATRLAHAFGMRVVAEGIERQPLVAHLRAIGVDLAQGFLFHRPCPAEAVRAF